MQLNQSFNRTLNEKDKKEISLKKLGNYRKFFTLWITISNGIVLLSLIIFKETSGKKRNQVIRISETIYIAQNRKGRMCS